MPTNLLMLILLAGMFLIAINTIAMLLVYIDDLELAAGKPGIPKGILIAFMVLGGAFGILLGLRFFKKRPSTRMLVNAAALTVIWLALIAAACIFVPKLIGGKQEETPVSTEADTSSEETEPAGTDPTEETDPTESESETEIESESESGEESGEDSTDESEEDTDPTETETQASSENAPSSETGKEAAEAEASRQAASAEASRKAAEEEAARQAALQASIAAAEASKQAAQSGPADANAKRITIAMIGDMLMHPGVSGLAIKATNPNYTSLSAIPANRPDYSFIFQAIQPVISSVDIAVVNNEVPFGGNEYGLPTYSTALRYNVYTELGDAEAAAGFDVILNATNHARDMGTEGVLRTINFWKKYPSITQLGTHESQADANRMRIIERQGVKIALFNYTYGSNSGLDPNRQWLIDCMRDQDKAKIAAELDRAEQQADFTIVFPHWGEEYRFETTAKQQEWAQFFTEHGADLIIGAHPHCLQPIRQITAANGRKSVCYFSLGNYISMQDETITNLGGMARVTLVADSKGVRIENYTMDYLVTHCTFEHQRYVNAKNAGMSEQEAVLEGYNSAYVVRLENYSDAMCAKQAIRTQNRTGADAGARANSAYPFTMSTFKRIIAECGLPMPAYMAPY